MSEELQQLVIFVVGASLATTPIFYALFERFIAPGMSKKSQRAFDKVETSDDPPVLIAGFGRVGQVVGRVLLARKIPFVALDASPDHVDFIRRFGNKVFYGDASRLELLEAAGASKAKVFVLAIDDVQSSLTCARAVQKHFPNLHIVARARNRQHAYELMAMGIKDLVRETFEGSVTLTRSVLTQLGVNFSDATRALELFSSYDEKLLVEGFEMRGDVERLQARANSARAELERIFEADAAALQDPPKPS